MGRGRGGRGGGKRSRTQARDFKEKRENVWRSNSKPNEWQALDMHNADFEGYYQAQKIVPEGEWEAFMTSLRTMLPTTFRINGSGKFAEDLRNRLQTDFLSSFGSRPVQMGGEDVQPPQPLPWYPRNLAWQMAFSRAQLRKLDGLTQVHEFMKRENEGGGITRQEAVSMIPPLFLDVQPHHLVLDMCAAPGSKTFQLLEAIHADSNTPTGIVIANDADAQRCNLLTHQVKRMCSPALLVSNHEAQLFPLINEPGKGPMLFDRILCDVPCSGDGTIRKAPDIWRKWTAANGNGLHPLQLRITLRACALLQVGGTLVYSTCTFNPVENEAVVAEVLRRTGGCMELLDVSAQLPDLKRVPGLRQWVVKDHPRSQFLSEYSHSTPEGDVRRLDPSMFPPSAADEVPLERCMRVLPHHSDTGGFFVAVLRKTRAITSIAPVTRPPWVHKGREGSKTADSSVPWPGRLSSVQDLPPDAPAAATPQPLQQPATDAAPTDAPTDASSAADTTQATAPDGVQPQTAADAVTDTSAAAEMPTNTSATAIGLEQGPTGNSASLAALAEGLTDVATGVGGGASALAVAWGVAGGTGRAFGGGTKWMGLDPVVPVNSPSVLESIASFYGLGSPDELKGQLVTRNAEQDSPKRLYIVGPAVGRLLAADERPSLKVTATGVKAFERQESKDVSVPCPYRIAQEGLPLLLPFITRQRVTVTAQDFLRLLTDRSVPVGQPVGQPGNDSSDLSNPAAALASVTAGAANDPELSGDANEGALDNGNKVETAASDGAQSAAAAASPEEEATPAARTAIKPVITSEKPKGPPITDQAALLQLSQIGNGCCVVTLRDEEAIALGLPSGSKAEGALAAAAPLALSCWRGRASLNILVSKAECAQVAEKLRRALRPQHSCGVPTSPLNPYAQEFKPAGAAPIATSEALATAEAGDVAGIVADESTHVGEKRSAEPLGLQSIEEAPVTKLSKTDL